MKSIKRQLKQVLALVVAWNCVFGNVFAQRMPLTVKQKHAVMSVIERIDAESASADDWLKRSEEGLAEIRAVWESAAIDLAGRDMFLAGVEEEFERAYAERLIESFFGVDAQKEQARYQTLMQSDTARALTAEADSQLLAARYPELARYAPTTEAARMLTGRRDTTFETAVVLDRAERSAIVGTDETVLSMVTALDTEEARSAWLSASSAASSNESEALLAVCAGADAGMKQIIEQGLSYLTETEALLSETARAALAQHAKESDDAYYRAGYFHPDLAPDSTALALYAKFTAEKSNWIQTAKAELASPTAERGLLAEDARVLARTYEAVHIPVRSMSEVIEDYRESKRFMDHASADTVVPDADNPLQPTKLMVEQNKMEQVRERTNSKQRLPIPAELIVLYIEQPKAKRKRRDDDDSQDGDTPAAGTGTVDKVLAQSGAPEKASARTLIEKEPGAELAGMIKDDGLVNDAFAEGKQADTNDKKSGEPTKEQEPKEQPEKKTRGSGNGAMLIDGTDTKESIKQETRNVSKAVVKEAKEEQKQEVSSTSMPQKEIVEPSQDPSKYDFTLTDLNKTLPEKQVEAQKACQEKWEKEKAELDAKLTALREEAKAAGYNDVFEYYNVEQRAETAAQNNGNETLETRVQAMKNTIGLLQDAKSYGLLTEAEQSKYVKKTTREIYIGDKKCDIEYEVISLSQSKGKLKDEVTYLNQKLLEKILREGNFAFSMLTNSKNAQITSNFGEAQGPVKINPQKVDGKTYYYYYEANMHTGIDIINTSATDPMDLIASLFVETMTVADGTIKMSVIGTDIRYRVSHLDTSTTDAINPGKLYTPGDVISDYPQGNNGKSSGTHYHIDVTCEVQDLKSPENTIRVFVDPQTLKVDERYSYYTFYYRLGNQVEDYVMVAYDTKTILTDIDGTPIYPGDPFLYKQQKTGTYHYEWYVNLSNEKQTITNAEGWIQYNTY